MAEHDDLQSDDTAAWGGLGLVFGSGLGMILGLLGWGVEGVAVGTGVGAAFGVVAGAALGALRGGRGATPQ